MMNPSFDKKARSLISKVLLGVFIAFLLLIGLSVAAYLTTTSVTTNTQTVDSIAETTTSSHSTSPGTTSSSSSVSAGNQLFFRLSCSGCSVVKGQYCGSYAGSLSDNFVVSQQEFDGGYDYYDPLRSTDISSQMYGNGSMNFAVSIPNNGTLVDWGFELDSCQGSLHVELVGANGTLIWQGDTNSTGSAYLYGAISEQFPTLRAACIQCLPSGQFYALITGAGSNFSQSESGSLSIQVPCDVSWNFKKTSTNGTLIVTLDLNNGTRIYDQNTTAPFGSVSGSWAC